MKLPSVRYYDESGNFSHRMSPELAAHELRTGNAEYIYEQRGEDQICIGIGPSRPMLIQYVMEQAKKCSITFEEMQANAGIGSNGAVLKAQEKVDNYYGPGMEPRLRAYKCNF